MARKKSQIGEVSKHPPQLVSDELRGWIDRVIVPILVEEWLRTRGLPEEANDG